MILNMKNLLKYLPRVSLILFFVGCSFFLYYSSPENLIEFIGVENVYFFIFILALIGGMTTFSGIPYHLVLVTLAIGDLNPILLGVSAAAGVTLGDSTSYFVGHQGRVIIPQGIQKILGKISAFGLKHPRLLPLFFFLYGSFVPFSNDFIVISMGLARYPFWRVMIPLGAGNLIFNISLAFLASYAYDFLRIVF